MVKKYLRLQFGGDPAYPEQHVEVREYWSVALYLVEGLYPDLCVKVKPYSNNYFGKGSILNYRCLYPDLPQELQLQQK